MWKRRNRIFFVIVFTSLLCTTSVFFLYPDMVWTNIIPMISNPIRDYLSEHSNVSSTTLTEKLSQTSSGRKTVISDKKEQSSEATTNVASEVTIKPEKVFVIVAYRDREEHKNVFVSEMNAYLTKKAN
jgi:hypothetical protein